MSRRTLTETERATRTARIDALSNAANDLEQNHAGDINLAALVLSKYSRRNVALILAQALERDRDLPQAVAGFHEWRAAGRIVRKGAKGYMVYAPIMKKNVAGEEEKKGYTIRYVFDVIDTDILSEDSPTLARDRDAVPA